MTPVPGKQGGATPQMEAVVGRLFRPVDWLAFLLVTIIVMFGYMLTIAPDLTLEDWGNWQ